MDVVISHENWSSSSALDSSTLMQVELCDLDGLDCIQQQFPQGSLFPSLDAGDLADHGYGPLLNDLEQLMWDPEEWHPEEELQVLSGVEVQHFWEFVVEVQAPHEDQVQGPPQAEAEVEAPGTMQFNPDLHAVDPSGWIQESESELEEWAPEEDLQVLSVEEIQPLWESVVEVQAPHEDQVQGPPQAEAEVDAPRMMHPNSEFRAVDLSGRIQESRSQDGVDGDIGQPAAEEERNAAWEEEWNAAWEEEWNAASEESSDAEEWNAASEESSDAEEPPPEFVHPVEDAVFPVVQPGQTVGITYHKKNNVWEAHIWIRGVTVRGRIKKGVQIFLGTFATAKDAACAHDRVAIKLQVRTSLRGKPYPLNYPEGEQADYLEKHLDWSRRDFIWSIRRNSMKFSKGVSELKGVSVRRRSPKGSLQQVLRYEAKVSQTAMETVEGKRKTYMLGLFKSEEEAGRKYDLALLFLHSHLPDVEQLGCITNFRPSGYSAIEIEDMGRRLVR